MDAAEPRQRAIELEADFGPIMLRTAVGLPSCAQDSRIGTPRC
jgi:hypothetical protein